MKEPRSGAYQVAGVLRERGVKTIFTVSGNQVLPLFDALFDDEVHMLSTRHEAAAVHMADAWGQLMGRAGVAIVTAGPGHGNALTALGVTGGNESPVVLLSGAAETSARGTGAFQELRQAELAAIVTKWAVSADDPATVGTLIERAFAVAEAPIPGPVSVSLPYDVQLARPPEVFPGTEPRPAGPAETRFDDLLKALDGASAPLLLGSPWVARTAAFRAAADRLECAAFGLDSARAGTDLYLLGSDAAFARADVVVLLAPWDYTARTPAIMAPHPGGLFQVWPAAPPAPAPATLRTIVGDPLDALEAIRALPLRQDRTDRAQVSAEQLAARQAVMTANERVVPPGVHPLRLADAVGRRLGAGDVVTMDGGEFCQWARLGVGWGLWRTLTNGKFGPIGSAVPHALGARAALGAGPAIVGFAGDGGFGYHALEIETAVREHLPAVLIVGTDGKWGAEWHLQIKRYGADRLIGSELSICHYEELARGLGGVGLLLENDSQIEATLDTAWRAMRDGRVVLINALAAPLASPAALH